MAHPPRIPVWLRADQEVVYFLTFCVARRERALANDEAFAAFESTIARLTNWNVIAAVLMPDHVHLLIAPNDREAKVGNAAGSIKRWMRQELNAEGSGSQAASIACFARMSLQRRSGNTCGKIRFEPVSSRIGRIGRTVLASNCRAGAPPAQIQ